MIRSGNVKRSIELFMGQLLKPTYRRLGGGKVRESTAAMSNCDSSCSRLGDHRSRVKRSSPDRSLKDGRQVVKVADVCRLFVERRSASIGTFLKDGVRRLSSPQAGHVVLRITWGQCEHTGRAYRDRDGREALCKGRRVAVGRCRYQIQINAP